MADIRFKDLTTTASTTAADDFFAADGATNGTRKLSAYSPSFGGNATVSGTLTVNGASIATAGQISSTATSALLAHQVYIYNGSSSGTNTALSGGRFIAQPGYSLLVGTTGNGTAASYQGGVLGGVVIDQQNYVVGDAANGLLIHGINGSIRFATGNTGTQRGSINGSGVWTIETTTASTTTSSGALVVGNGTSGGLGVGGAINAGSSISSWTGTFVARAASANPSFYAWTENTVADRGVLGFEAASSTLKYRAGGYSMSTGTEVFSITNAGVVSVLATTASTSTSSGALVVSGGVGVAGAVFAGGDIHSVGSNASLTVWKDSTPTKAAQLMFSALGDDGVGIRVYNGTSWSTAVNVGPLGTLTANASSNAFRIATAQTPASATATGTAGTICWDTSYIYVCTATNTWKRVAISTW